jgi:hypothetical protein
MQQNRISPDKNLVEGVRTVASELMLSGEVFSLGDLLDVYTLVDHTPIEKILKNPRADDEKVIAISGEVADRKHHSCSSNISH